MSPQHHHSQCTPHHHHYRCCRFHWNCAAGGSAALVTCTHPAELQLTRAERAPRSILPTLPQNREETSSTDPCFAAARSHLTTQTQPCARSTHFARTLAARIYPAGHTPSMCRLQGRVAPCSGTRRTHSYAHQQEHCVRHGRAVIAPLASLEVRRPRGTLASAELAFRTVRAVKRATCTHAG